MPRKTKKQLILEICDREGLQEISRREVERINARLIEEFGPGGKSSPDYIAKILAEAGKRVLYSSLLVDSGEEEKYAKLFRGVLKFDTLENAEESIKEIGRRYREFIESGDKEGAHYCRKIALKGKDLAKSAAHNPKIDPQKRAEKAEIAQWFTLWLRTPDLFSVWIELRKRSEDFQREFKQNR